MIQGHILQDPFYLLCTVVDIDDDRGLGELYTSWWIMYFKHKAIAFDEWMICVISFLQGIPHQFLNQFLTRNVNAQFRNPYTFSQKHISCDLRYFLFLLSQREHVVTHFRPPNFPFNNTEEATENIENIYQDMLRWVHRMLPTKRILCLHIESVWLGSWSARSPAWARLQRAFDLSHLRSWSNHKATPTQNCVQSVF